MIFLKVTAGHRLWGKWMPSTLPRLSEWQLSSFTEWMCAIASAFWAYFPTVQCSCWKFRFLITLMYLSCWKQRLRCFQDESLLEGTVHSCLSKKQINHFKDSNIHKIKAQRKQIWKCKEKCVQKSQLLQTKAAWPYCESLFFKSTRHFTLLTPSHTANKMNCFLSFVTINCMQYRFIITLESTENTKHF